MTALVPTGSAIQSIPYVVYDETGRIVGRGSDVPHSIQVQRNIGLRILEVAVAYSFQLEDAAVPVYVDLSGSEPVLRNRPVWEPEIDTLEPVARQELVVANAPACTAFFTGPKSGKQDHPQAGPLSIGWVTPGSYKLKLDAFPAMPVELDVTVKPRVAS